VTQFQGIFPVCCKKGNNSTITCWVNPERQALEASTFVNWVQAFVLQYMTVIGQNSTIIVSINGSKFHHVILFVVAHLLTPQPLVCFTPPDQRWNNTTMAILIEYLIVQIRKILMEIRHFLSASLWWAVSENSCSILTIYLVIFHL
jgi:hypothetical protein